jgi:hypothetical protein
LLLGIKDVYFEVSEEEFKDLEEIGVEDTVNSWLYDTYSVEFIEYKAIKFIYNNYDVILQGILTIISIRNA